LRTKIDRNFLFCDQYQGKSQKFVAYNCLQLLEDITTLTPSKINLKYTIYLILLALMAWRNLSQSLAINIKSAPLQVLNNFPPTEPFLYLSRRRRSCHNSVYHSNTKKWPKIILNVVLVLFIKLHIIASIQGFGFYH
jgi:hypothetical protein